MATATKTITRTLSARMNDEDITGVSEIVTAIGEHALPTFFDWITLGVSVVAIGLTIIIYKTQTKIMKDQTAISQQQTSISEKQTEIMDQQNKIALMDQQINCLSELYNIKIWIEKIKELNGNVRTKNNILNDFSEIHFSSQEVLEKKVQIIAKFYKIELILNQIKYYFVIDDKDDLNMILNYYNKCVWGLMGNHYIPENEIQNLISSYTILINIIEDLEKQIK